MVKLNQDLYGYPACTVGIPVVSLVLDPAVRGVRLNHVVHQFTRSTLPTLRHPQPRDQGLVVWAPHPGHEQRLLIHLQKMGTYILRWFV